MKVGDKVKFKPLYQKMLPIITTDKVFTVMRVRKTAIIIGWKSSIKGIESKLAFIVQTKYINALEIVPT